MHEASYCFWHNPYTAAERDAANRRGGAVGASRTLPSDTPDAKLETLSDVQGFLAESINQLRRGELDAKTANAVGYLASILMRAIEGGELEKRLTTLEERGAKWD